MKSWHIKYGVLGSRIILLGALFLVASCKKNVLEEKPIDFVSAANAFETPGDVELGVVGLYSLGRNWYSNVDEKYMFCYVALGTDEAYSGEDPGAGTLSNWDTEITPVGSLPLQYWTKAFDLVYQANTVMVGIENMDWVNTTQENSYMAETRFFRAFSYRILVTMFGDVPLLDKPVTTPRTDFVRNSADSVYALIEADLLFAAAHLPVRGKEAAPGRLTQGAAWHLLSDVYLAQKKYQQAADAASHVINDYGYGLMTTRFGNQPRYFTTENAFFDLFTMNNHNLPTNTEGIWVIQNDPVVTGGGQYSGERAFGPAYYRIGNTPDGVAAILGKNLNGVYTGYSDTLGRPVAWCRPTSYVAYDIWKSYWNDDRNTEANIKRSFYFDNPKSKYDDKKIEWSLYTSRSSPLKDTTQYIFPYFMKVAAPMSHYTDETRSGGGYNHKDLYAMRLAETYLLRAEAYLGLGQTGKAADDINVVRNRAHATPVSAGDVTIDYILDERARELYTEEWRMLILMRLGILVDRVRKFNDNPVNKGLNIKDYHNLFPIPQSEIDLNTEAVLGQNQGYK